MIFILAGPVHAGKTTLLKEVVDRLKRFPIRVEGFLSLAVFDGGDRTGYDLFDIATGLTTPLLRRQGEALGQRTGPYRLVPEGLERAESILLNATKVDLLVVDEVGPLELKGKGLWPALEKGMVQAGQTGLLVVREALVEEIKALLGERPISLFHVRDQEVCSRLMEAIKQTLKE
jgi:nucleoside-triphosphatase THEP1